MKKSLGYARYVETMVRRRKKFRPQTIFISSAVEKNFVCGRNSVPLRWYRRSTAVVQKFQHAGTTVPTQWYKNWYARRFVFSFRNRNFAPVKAIIDNKIPYIRGPITSLVDEAVFLTGSAISADDVRDADILIVRTRTRVDERLLRDSRVRLVVTATIGFDHLDTDYLRRRGIEWTNCPGCNATSVVQYVHNSLLALGRLREGMKAGVVGVGHVGSRVADDLRRSGLHVQLCDPPRLGTPAFDQMDWSDCDLITFHTPLVRDGHYPTLHMADDRFFSRLTRQPLIINAARGGVVDEQALLRAMDRNLVGGAVIDTWEGEPAVNPLLLDRALIATPHIAGYSADGKANATRMSLEAVARFLHRPFNVEITLPTLPPDSSYGTEKAGPLRLYDPRTDSERLKQNPENFESLRGNYPLRRER